MLTPKQKAIYEFILSYYKKNDYSPSIREIAKHFKRSTPTVHKIINIIVKKGYLKKSRDGARNIIPIGKDSKFKKERIIRIGIIGYGIVGQAVEYGFSKQEIHIYDKYKKTEELDTVIFNSDYIFVCLPTPIKEDESGIDLSIINRMVRRINKYTSGTDKIIIIKSTVIPGTTSRFIKKYPKSLFCFNPEFLTEKSFLQDFISSDRIVIGSENSSVARRVASIYQAVLPKTPIFQTDPTTAEMVKYMANCYLATKVIFANEMAEICEKLNIQYDEVKSITVADSRIFDSHLDVTSNRGFGGKCFPKDLLALKALAKKEGVETEILSAVWRKNLKIRKVRDWEEIPFAVSKSFGHKG